MSSSDSSNDNSLLDSRRSRFYQNLYLPNTNDVKILNDLTNLKSCYGYDITTIIILFQKYKLSGKIQLETKTNQTNAVVFQEGQIQYIELSDTDTRIGTLLINNGLISKAQLEQALSEKTDLPIGAYLVQQGLINREQIGTVLLAQSRTRLSKLINEDQYAIKVIGSETKIKSSELNLEQFFLLVHDWILSKFTPEWLNAHYLEYYNFKITVNWSDFQMADAMNYSVLTLFKDSFIDIIDGQKISDLAIKYENNKNFFKAIHFLVLLKWITIRPSGEADNYEIKIKHVYKLIMNKTGMDLVKQLSLITKLDERSIDQIYEELQKTYLGPESLVNEFKLEIDKKVLNLLINFRNLQNISSDSQLEKKQISQKAVDTKAIKTLLLAQKYNEALALVKKSKDMLTQTPQLQLFSAWAHMGLALFKGTQISAGTLEKEFLNVLPEDMTTGDYHYVNYMLLKVKRQDGQASLALKKAYEIDPATKAYPVVKSLFGWF